MSAPMAVEPPPSSRAVRSEGLLATVATRRRAVLISHVNPDPDALASMMGLQALIEAKLPGREVVLTYDGMIARAENKAMVELLDIPLVPVADVPMGPDAAVIMVDSQPHTGRRESEAITPMIVLDHHQTGGTLAGVAYRDIRPNVGATTTMVLGYLLEQEVPVTRRLATALLYGIESEIMGYPREASPADDGALVWLYPRADKDMLARIRNPKLPRSYFATFQHALANAFLYRDAVLCWCGPVTQPDIVAELADFFVRFDQVDWAICAGEFEGQLKISARCDYIGGHCGEVLRAAVDGMGTAGGHDRRAGGAIRLSSVPDRTVSDLLRVINARILERLGIADRKGRRLLESCPVIPTP